MELFTDNSKFQFESSLLEEACNGMEELGLLKKIENNDEQAKNLQNTKKTKIYERTR